jgi:arylsulfatase A-like enzyme
MVQRLRDKFQSARRWILSFTLFVGLTFKGLAASTHASPNIVVILADDLGFSDLSCYGSEISTPNLDRMASEGLRMTQFYTTPRCCPSRAAFLTGLYSQQTGVGDMMEDRGVPGYRGELNRDCLTVAEELRLADYHTAMVGKWHLSHIYFDQKKQLNFETNEPFWDTKDSWPLQRGFESYYGTIHGVNSYYDPFSLVDGNTPIRAQGTNFYYTDDITKHALGDLDHYASAGKPFFLYVAYTAPHWPLQAPEKDIAKYRERYLAGWDAIRAARYQRQMQMGIIDKSWRLSLRDPRVPPWTNIVDRAWQANRMATYAAMIEHLDDGVGQILDKLKALGIDDNTLVIFFSDNGSCAEDIMPQWYDVPSRMRDGRRVFSGNNDDSVFAGPDNVWESYGTPWANVSATPFRLYKHFAHEGGIAVPFIVHWPAVIKDPGAISAELAHVTDIKATLLDIAGVKHPKHYEGHAILPLEGESLLAVFEGKNRPNRSPIFWEHEGNRAVRLDQWKLVALRDKPWELYDMNVDRTELTNVAASYPEKVKKLSALYDAWASRCHVLPFDQLPHEVPIVPAKDGAEAVSLISDD